MQLQRFNTPQEFLAHVQEFLLRHEAEHNSLLGTLYNLVHYPERYPEPAYLAICTSPNPGQLSSVGGAVCATDKTKTKTHPNAVGEDSPAEPGTADRGDTILAVAIRTPPYKVMLSKSLDLDAVQLIAQDLQHESQQLPGVNGPVAEVAAFLQAWQTLTGQSYRQVMQMRIYQLTQVARVATAPGQLRLATEADRPLLLEWFTAFVSANREVMREAPERLVEGGLKRQSIHLWEDGTAVSWASGTRSLPAAARIGPVFTPPEYQRKGYATACVAALSQKFLDQGCDRCFLFTDLANPTSNRIYQQIGYRPVCDWHDYSFIVQAQ